MMCHIGLFVNTSGREKKQTGFSERHVLLPLVHVSIQRSRCFLLWAVLSIFSALFLLSAFSLNSTAARPPLILVELVTVTYTPPYLLHQTHHLAPCAVSCRMAVCCVQCSHLLMSHSPACTERCLLCTWGELQPPSLWMRAFENLQQMF